MGAGGACQEGGETFMVFLSRESPTHLWDVLFGVVCLTVEQVLAGLCARQ